MDSRAGADVEDSSDKLKLLFSLLRCFCLHVHQDRGALHRGWVVYSACLFTGFIAVSAVSDVLTFMFRLAAMRAVLTPKFGLIAGIIDSGRVILLIASLTSHLIIVQRNKKRFHRIYRSRALHKSSLQCLNHIPVSVIIFVARISLFVFMLITIAQIFRRYLNIAYEMSITVGSYGLFLVLLQYYTLLSVYTQRISLLTNTLSRMDEVDLENSNALSQAIAQHSSGLLQIEEIIRLFGWQLTLGICFVYMEFTVNVYYIIYVCILEMVKQFMLRHLLYLVQNLLRGFFLAQLLVVVVRSSGETLYYVDAFYKELFRLMRESKTLCSNKKLCLYVSMRKTINFTACGFFSLGYPLITSIIAAATTYLVILVQFSIPKSS